MAVELVSSPSGLPQVIYKSCERGWFSSFMEKKKRCMQRLLVAVILIVTWKNLRICGGEKSPRQKMEELKAKGRETETETEKGWEGQ